MNIETIKTQFWEEEISFQQAAALLHNIGHSPEEAGEIVAQWEADREMER